MNQTKPKEMRFEDRQSQTPDFGLFFVYLEGKTFVTVNLADNFSFKLYASDFDEI